MKAYYKREIATFRDATILDEQGQIELWEETPNDIVEYVGWDGIEDICRKQKWFRVERKRKGLVFRTPMEKLEKQWRNPNFSIYHEIIYYEANPSIMDILNYPNIEKAAQYLKERGINIMESLK